QHLNGLKISDNSTNLIHKLPVAVDGDVGAFDGSAFGHAREELAGDLRQQGAGDDVIDVAGAALDFLAAAGDGRQQGVVIGKRRLVILAHAVGDALELKLDNLTDHLIGEREIRNDIDSAQERGLEGLEQV